MSDENLSNDLDLCQNSDKDSELLQKAIDNEQLIFTSYAKISLKFNNTQPPFFKIMEDKFRHIEMIQSLMQKLEVEAKELDVSKVPENKGLEDAFEISISLERESIKFYEKLLEEVKDDEIKDLFFRLQAASFNDHLPALREGFVKCYMAKDNSAQPNLDEFGNILQKMMNNDIKPADFLNFLNSPNSSLLGGIVVGGVAVSILDQILDKKRQKQ